MSWIAACALIAGVLVAGFVLGSSDERGRTPRKGTLVPVPVERDPVTRLQKGENGGRL